MVNKDKYGRHRTNMPLLDEIKTLGLNNVVLCGELYMKGGNIYDFLRNRDNDNLTFAIFDIWEYKIINGGYYPLQNIPYSKRRNSLEELFKNTNFTNTHISHCKIVNDKYELDQERLRAVKQYEGIIAKTSGSIWVNADVKNWIKFKKEKTADLVVMGYSRKAKNLSILLGYNENGRLKELCGCGSGFTLLEKQQYKQVLEQEKLPNHFQTNREYILTNPKHIVEVIYQEVTKINGKISSIRHPIFKRFRDDKTIKDTSIL